MDVKTVVKEKYTEVVTQSTGCCGPSCCSPTEVDNVNESYDHLEGYYEGADLGLGCGIPTEFAAIKEGNTVLDLGSGAGNDVFVARRLVGDSGKVVGVDMTEAMIEKANANKKKLGYENVEFVLGDIENLPLQADSIDVAISNCVLNLVPDKVKAYQEVFRVLKKGGHFSMSDIVTDGELPENVQRAAALYAGCISGALTKTEYVDAIKEAGFEEVTIAKERTLHFPDSLFLQYITKDELQAFRDNGVGIYSITVTGTK